MNHALHIRMANIDDLAVLVDIYNQAIASNIATADLTPFTLEERKVWFAQFDASSYPLYVATIDHQVVGYATLSPYRNGREALRKVAEISFYLDYSAIGKGIGSALVQHILTDCARLGKETLVAILVAANSASIGLLQKFNFKEWGNLPLKSDFNGKCYGHLIYGLNLEDV